MVFAFPPQGIISREQGNRTKAGEGGHCGFPSFFRSVFYPSGMFSCFSLPPSSSPPEDGFLSFSEKREKRKTAFRAGSPFSVFLLGKLSFSSLLRNASSCRPLRREKEKKEIAMLSESVVRGKEPPSFLLFSGRTFPPFFPKKERKEKTEHRNPSSRRKAFPASRREKEKKEKSERKESSCLSGRTLLPALGEKAKRKGGTPFFGTVLPFCRKRGTPPDAGSGREEKGNLLQRTGENLLSPLFLKKEKKKALSLCSLPFSAAVRHHAIARKKKKKKHHSNYGQKKKKKREAPSFPCCLLPSFSCVPSSALF